MYILQGVMVFIFYHQNGLQENIYQIDDNVKKPGTYEIGFFCILQINNSRILIHICYFVVIKQMTI